MKNKKLLSLFLAVLMLVAIPFSVFAEVEDAEETKSEGPAVVETVEEKETTEEETPQESAKEVVEATEEVEEATEEPAEELEVGKPLMAPPLKAPLTNPVKVTFNYNNDEGITESKNVEKDTEVTLPTNGGTKEGYIFDGWSKGGTKVTTDKVKITENTTFEGQWKAEPTKYTVTFKNGDTETLVKVVENQKVPKPTDPTKEGYNFLGWYDGNTIFDF